jgi:hypothetical protein
VARRWLQILAFFLVALIVVFLLGPRVPIDEEISRRALPDDLDSYVDSVESQYSDIVEGTGRKIVWWSNPESKTSVSFVFIHGFSSTRAELAPLCDSLARRFRANLFYARLTGHGRPGAELAKAQVNNWLNDVGRGGGYRISHR